MPDASNAGSPTAAEPLRFPSASASRAAQAAPAGRLEAVFLGNLPGFGGPWLTQYANYVAQRRGPVAVLHLDEPHIDLDLVTHGGAATRDRDGEDTTSERALEAWVRDAADGELLEVLDGLATFEGAATRSWLVHLPTPAADATLKVAGEFLRWTIICGADEAAVAGAHRLIRQLVESNPGPAREVGLMIMGSDDARGRLIAERLIARCAEFLPNGYTVSMAGAQKQMAPVSLHHLGSFEGATAGWADLRDFLRALDADAVVPAEASGAQAGDAVPLMDADEALQAALSTPRDQADELSLDLDQLPDDLELAPGMAWAAPAPLPDTPASAPVVGEMRKRQGDGTPAQAAKVAAAAPEAAASPAMAAPPRRAPAPPMTPAAAAAPRPSPVATPPPTVAVDLAGMPETAAPVAAVSPAKPAVAELDLSQFLPAGGVTLHARCPRQPQTQLILDENGVLHLLRRHTPAAGGAAPNAANRHEAAGESLRAALTDLVEARAWVREHLDLIRLTQRQCHFDTAAEPVLHLFTDESKHATALVARLGGFLKLHLLQGVRVGSEKAWFSTELN